MPKSPRKPSRPGRDARTRVRTPRTPKAPRLDPRLQPGRGPQQNHGGRPPLFPGRTGGR